MLQFLRTAYTILAELGDEQPHVMRWDDTDA
jgi:hypothetical protein